MQRQIGRGLKNKHRDDFLKMCYVPIYFFNTSFSDFTQKSTNFSFEL